MKRWILLLVFICSISLAGCLEKNLKEASPEGEISEAKQHQKNNLESKSGIDEIEAQEKLRESGPVVITLIDPQTEEIIKTLMPRELGYETNPAQYRREIEKLAKELARGTDATAGYDQKMILDRIDEDGQVIKGRPLVILKESELVEKLLAASITGGDIELPLYLTESNYKIQDVPHLDEIVVASYKTYFNAAEVGRSRNIELSAKALNNVILGSGDYFSFNTMVGPRTEATGYQPAPEIVNKKRVMGIGGGICQTSSTLFNAVDQLSLNFVERHHHSLEVGYVPKGRDATVSYGTLDFRFQNSNEVPLLLKMFYEQGALTVEIRTATKYKDSLNE